MGFAAQRSEAGTLPGAYWAGSSRWRDFWSPGRTSWDIWSPRAPEITAANWRT